MLWPYDTHDTVIILSTLLIGVGLMAGMLTLGLVRILLALRQLQQGHVHQGFNDQAQQAVLRSRLESAHTQTHAGISHLENELVRTREEFLAAIESLQQTAKTQAYREAGAFTARELLAHTHLHGLHHPPDPAPPTPP